MSRVVEMLSASLRIVATRSTVGKAENSSGLWIHKATIRISTASAIDSARPKSIMNAGTGRKKRQRMSTMPTAKAMSLPPRFAAGAIPAVVNDIAALARQAPRFTRRPWTGQWPAKLARGSNAGDKSATLETRMSFPVLEHVAKSARHTTFFLSCGASQATPIIFLHGWPELSISWRKQLPAFAALGFRTIAPDMRGYGRSSVHPQQADYALEEIVADMVELLEALEAKKAIWIGHDWGAPVVWSIAQVHPDL